MRRNKAETAPLDFPDVRFPSGSTAPLYFGQQPTIDSVDGVPAFTMPEEVNNPGFNKPAATGDEERPKKERISEDKSAAVPRRRRFNMWQLLQVVPADSQLRNAWDIIYDVLILYSLCTSTYYLAFQHPGIGLYVFDIFVWIFFVVDVILTFNTAYTDEDNHSVTSRRAIALHYLSTWLIIDIVALLPFSFGDPDSDVEYYLRLVRFLRIPDSVNFVDGTGIGFLFSVAVKHLPELKMGDFMVSYYYVSLIVQQMVRMILLSYFLAAFYYWYAQYTGPQHVYGDMWFDDSARLTGESGDIQFLHSWYYMLTTLLTIGYGDILPLSFCERILAIFILLIGITNFSLILSSFVTLITEINEMNTSSDMVTQVSNWMDSIELSGNKIAPNMKSKVLKHFANYGKMDRLGQLAVAWWQADSVEDMTTCGDEIYGGLPEHIRKQIIYFLFSDVFTKYRSFFSSSTCNFAYEVAFHFQPRSFRHFEPILEEGEEATEVLLLVNGQVSCEFCIRAEHHQLLFFDRTLVIGDYQAFTNTTSKFTYQVMSQNCQMLAIPILPFIEILEVNYPTSQKRTVLQRASQFNSMLIKTRDEYLAKKHPEVLMGRRVSTFATKALLQKVVKKAPMDHYTTAVRET